ncbi:unnamed protein product [Fusarium equiseti]|uniref:Uncharacterized protein n=1 Tax=Fusarium equiseti TaxID=61235 RepID=A0A8J2NE72_FUSEQ|nr:unnamed protein product [Fusarium equiseti]
MPPVDTPSLAYQMSYVSSGLENQEARAVEQRHTEARSCIGTRETGQYGRGKLLELAAVKGEDPTHILFRRHVESGSLCIDLEAYYLDRDAIALKKMVESEDQDLEEHHEKFMARLRRFCEA